MVIRLSRSQSQEVKPDPAAVLLSRGVRSGPCGELVTCPWHGWRFDVRTGQSPHVPGEQVRTFPVRVVEGAVEVGVDGGADSIQFGDVHKP